MEFRLLSYIGEKGTPRAGLLLEDKNVMDIELALGVRKASIEGLDPTSVLSVGGKLGECFAGSQRHR